MTGNRVILIGLDAAEPALLHRWSADGSLPTIARLLERGISGAVRGLPGFFIGSTWPSFYTGVSPASHGFHYQVQLRSGTYDFYRPEDHGLVRVPPFWRHLSGAGRRVAILDMPLAALDPAINGIQTVEWGGHDAVYGFGAQPAALALEIRDRHGTHPAGPNCDASKRSAADYRRFVDDLVRGVRVKAALTRELLRRERWDFFAQVFTETHCVGHQCWHLHDPTHPAHDPEFARRQFDPLREVYRAVDQAIAGILEDAGDALVVVMSAHGMGSFHGAQFMLRDILVGLGVTALPAAPANHARPPGRLESTLRTAWQRVPERVREQVWSLRHRVRSRRHHHATPATSPSPGVDLALSHCFPLSNGLGTGGIRLNLAGREPRGILQPGEDTERFVAALTEDLLALVNETNDQPLVARVLRTREHHAGAAIEALPDLIVEWNPAVPTGSRFVGSGVASRVIAASPKLGRLERENTYGRTGEHRPEGLFIANGPSLQHQQLSTPVSVLDFVPTFCALLDVDPPHTDGRAIEALIRHAPKGA